ncbi:hypothetical protein KAR91_41140 [Candidatus Pacearchaeota archaeon]|nr:hypothetical protein [Candidatus Pacearchaeota archaeon]
MNDDKLKVESTGLHSVLNGIVQISAEIEKYELLAKKKRDIIRKFQQKIDDLRDIINKTQKLAVLYDEQVECLRQKRDAKRSAGLTILHKG